MKQRGRKKERRREEKKKERRKHDDNVLLPAAATFPIRLPRKLIIAHFSLSIVVVYLSRNHDAVCVPQRNRRPRLLNGGARRVKRERERSVRNYIKKETLLQNKSLFFDIDYF